MVRGWSSVPVGIAERLHRAGRPAEALRWLELSDRPPPFAEITTDLHVAILEALGRGDDARAVRWRAFERTLSFEQYRDCRDRTPQPEREEIRRRAIALAMDHDRVHPALEFLVAMEALAEAEDMVLRRTAELNGRNYRTLRPVARALAPDYPTVAILLYRLLSEAVLRAGKSQYYRYGIGDLREATLLAEGVGDWRGTEDHETFMARLRAKYGRKWSFWKQW